MVVTVSCDHDILQTDFVVVRLYFSGVVGVLRLRGNRIARSGLAGVVVNCHG